MKHNTINIDKDLLYRYISETADELEQQLVKQWIDADLQNKSEYESVKQLWEISSCIDDADFDTAGALSKVKKRIAPNDKRNRNFRLPVIIKIAAVLLIPLALYFIFESQNGSHESSALITFTSPTKQQITLPDGTRVFMNSGAQIIYPESFSDSLRQVEFEGEAFFEVHKNAKQAFVIKSNNSLIRVLGTAFNVNSVAGKDSVSVVVTEGKVRFSFQNKSGVVLTLGEKGIISLKSGKTIKQSNSDKNFLSWKTGKFEFDNTPLQQAFSELSAFYNITFELQNNELNNYRLTATYDSLQIADLQDVLEITLNTKIEIQQNKFIVR